ncbi:MAG: metallophosphoesterase [Clostridia bacterium]|nr:metallophosphoesterase [Clostridia bacterium]
MLRKMLSMLLCVIMIFGSITCGFGFSVSAAAENMILTPTKPTSLRSTTAATRLTGWSRSSSGSSAVTTEDGYTVVSRTGVANGTLFTNTFTLTKNSTYKFSFEIKAVEGTSFTYTKSSTGETLPRGVNFVLNDFNVVKSDGTAYNTYQEGQTDYAHTNKANYNNPTRSGFTATWSHELADGSIHTENQIKYSSWGRKIGTSEASTALKTVDLSELYSDWRTVTCEFTLPDEDVYIASDIAIGFVLPAGAANGGIYVRNIKMHKQEVSVPISEIPISVVDINGNAHSTQKDFYAVTTTKYNADDSVTVTVDYDEMDTVNIFKGWYEGDKFLSNDTSYTLGADVDEHNVKAVILSRSVINGGLGFEGYKETTSLRVSPDDADKALQNIAPFDDKWGQIYNSYQQENDYAFDIKATYGDVTTKYTPTYDTATGKWTTDSITVKPYSGNSMFYFATRFRTIVRKLDNLKPNSNYELSFYTFNLSEWDFLNTAVVADSYLLGNGKTTTSGDIKVYSVFKADVVSENGENVLVDKNQVRNWHKITINFTTDDDDTALYLHLRQEVGNNSSSTSKQFIDNLTCCETIIGNMGNAIRAKNGDKPQALRYKFFMSNDKIESFGDMTTAKIGILAVKNEICGTDSLEIGKKYIFNGEETDIIDVEVNPDTNFQYKTGDSYSTYFTAALYNIGAKGGRVDYDDFAEDYSVRPYVIYKDKNGSELLFYGDTVNANVFNVMYAIVRDNTSDEDVATAKAMLENNTLAEVYYDWQPTNSWYIGESKATDYAYSFAVIGDVQKTTGYYPDKLHYIYDWIIDNADDKNIQYVMGLGDLSEHANPTAEWPVVTEQHYRLEQAGLNQSIVRGNHDWRFDTYITKDKFGSKLTGSYDDTMKNTYRLITIGGIKYMMLTLNLFPTNDEIAWAERVITENPDYNVILTTHAYFDHDMSLTQDDDIDWVDDINIANSGQDIYDKLVSKYSNIVLVMCGHRYPPDDGPNYHITTREDGSKVMEMMINPQRMESNGGRSYGMLAMLYVSEDGRSIQLEYFSTISGMFYMDKFQFSFELDLVD